MTENVPALEEGEDSSDDVEILPQQPCRLTENSSGSDSTTEASSDRDEENAASGYLADTEMEPRRRIRVSRIKPRLKSKAGDIVQC